MTQEQIIEGNKLIALFMGFKEEEIQAEDWCGCNVLEDNGFGVLEMFTANYHENWSRLMPVVEKCVSIAEELEEYGKVDAELYMFITNNIVAVWQSCVSFITWYNQQPK